MHSQSQVCCITLIDLHYTLIYSVNAYDILPMNKNKSYDHIVNFHVNYTLPRTFHLVENLHLLYKAFLCKCNSAFSFACGRFQVVSYPNNSNPKTSIVLKYIRYIYSSIHTICPIDLQ